MEGIPYITVITPTYNLIEKELVDEFNILTTLLSKQTYPNVEHLIIDKASKDGTIQLLSDYKSKGYIQFYSEPDTGRFDALNKGIMRARGKYVAFLNPSDFIHDIMSLEEIISAMEENGADYSFGTSYALHPEGVIFPFAPAILNVFQVLPCPLQAMVFRKDVLASENYFDHKFKSMADFDLIIRLVMKEYYGILYEKNYVTYKISNDVLEGMDKIEAESRSIYIKNFRSIYPLTAEIVDKITKYSDFPRDLLEKLSKYFPENVRENFFAACEEMHKLRLEAYNEAHGISTGKDSVQNETPVQKQVPPPLSQNQQQVRPRLQMPGMPGMSGMSGMRQTNPMQNQRPHMPGMGQ